MSAPLQGVVVVTVEQAVAASLATRHLADLGATVLKVERPDGGDFARDYDTNESRIANVDDLEAVISAHLAKTPADTVLEGLKAGRVAHAWVRNPLEVWNHEQLAARDRFIPVSLPTGQATMLRPPFNISDCPDTPTKFPALGEHDPALVDRIASRSTGR